MDLNPGKGVRALVDTDMAAWLLAVHEEIDTAFRTCTTSRGYLDYLVKECDWEFEQDKFGQKASIGYEVDSKNSLYVTVVVNDSNGKVSVDYRNWYKKD